MNSPRSIRLRATTPSTGSRNWWLLYLFAPLVVVGGGILTFPEVVYDRFLWQYLWGPVVADASGEPVTHHGIEATAGYNPWNTIAYLSIVLYSLLGIRAFLDALTIDLTTRLAYALAPILIAGGAMRALEDASVLGPAAVWFITPSIYFVIAGVTCTGLAIGASLRDRGLVSVSATVGILGGVWALLTIGWALWYGVTTAETFRPVVPVLTLGIAIAVTGSLYFVGSTTGRAALQHPMYVLLVFGQMWDAAQNLVGVTLFGYTPKMFLTLQVYQWTGFSGSTFLLKFFAVIIVVWVLADGDDDLPQRQWWLIAMVIIVVGLPMGVRGTIRMMIGV